LDVKRTKAARDKAKEDHDLEFIAIDGEGINFTRRVRRIDPETLIAVRDEHGKPVIDEETVQKYVLVSCGEESLWFPDEHELTHDEILTFLYDQFKAHPKAVFIGFSLRYDFNFWLKSMPEDTAWRLLTEKGRASRTKKLDSGYNFVRPARDGGKFAYWDEEECNFLRGWITPKWEIQMLGMKSFQFRPYVPWEDRPIVRKKMSDGTYKETRKGEPFMHICDTFPFFQSSLQAVIEGVMKDPNQTMISDEEYQIIEHGKNHLRTTATHITPELIRYNITENLVLARRVAELNRGFVEDGIRLSRKQWYGPGQAAQTWMKNVGFPTAKTCRPHVPKWALDAAHDSYYGGWFEIFAHGLVPGTSYDYDINSAYPSVIAKLPCLLHGRWSRSKTLPAPVHGDRRAAPRLRGHRRSNHFVGPAPAPHEGRVHHAAPVHPRVALAPRAGGVAARRAPEVDDVRKVVTYEPCACPSPGEPIADLYEGRLKLGKNSPRGKARKYVYNSSYGKCAQSVGAPKFANPVYASLITAGCRTMILDAIATHPTKSASLLMVATDGIVFREPHPGLFIDPKEGLGNWSMKTYENLTLFMPGVYWDDEHRRQIEAGKVPGLKSRGVSARYMPELVPAIDAQFRALNSWLGENPPWPEHTLRISFAQTSAKQAITRGRWDLCAKIDEHGVRKLSGNPVAKRNSSGVKHVGDITRTFLHVHDPDAVKDETTYYPTDRMFGMTGENPGPGGGLIVPEEIDVMDTPDGPVLLEFLEGFDR
jgi:hypothetical protein